MKANSQTSFTGSQKQKQKKNQQPTYHWCNWMKAIAFLFLLALAAALAKEVLTDGGEETKLEQDDPADPLIRYDCCTYGPGCYSETCQPQSWGPCPPTLDGHPLVRQWGTLKCSACGCLE